MGAREQKGPTCQMERRNVIIFLRFNVYGQQSIWQRVPRRVCKPDVDHFPGSKKRSMHHLRKQGCMGKHEGWLLWGNRMWDYISSPAAILQPWGTHCQNNKKEETKDKSCECTQELTNGIHSIARRRGLMACTCYWLGWSRKLWRKQYSSSVLG